MRVLVALLLSHFAFSSLAHAQRSKGNAGTCKDNQTLESHIKGMFYLCEQSQSLEGIGPEYQELASSKEGELQKLRHDSDNYRKSLREDGWMNATIRPQLEGVDPQKMPCAPGTVRDKHQMMKKTIDSNRKRFTKSAELCEKAIAHAKNKCLPKGRPGESVEPKYGVQNTSEEFAGLNFAQLQNMKFAIAKAESNLKKIEEDRDRLQEDMSNLSGRQDDMADELVGQTATWSNFFTDNYEVAKRNPCTINGMIDHGVSKAGEFSTAGKGLQMMRAGKKYGKQALDWALGRGKKNDSSSSLDGVSTREKYDRIDQGSTYEFDAPMVGPPPAEVAAQGNSPQPVAPAAMGLKGAFQGGGAHLEMNPEDSELGRMFEHRVNTD